jgi:lambda family phage tail tape measure protein
VSQQYVDQKESVKEQMQALEIQYGLTTQKQAEEIAFEQQMDELRKAARFTTLAKDVEELIAKLRNARQAAESFGNQMAKSFAETVKQSGELAQNLGATLGNAFLGLGDQLADFVQTGKMQFADFARSVLNDLSRILIRFAMFQALKAVVPGGSALGKFLGFADGGIMTSNGSMPLKRYANGGIATSPQIAMFGEGSRPEAYVPLPDGRSIPVKMKGGGDGGNVVVNVDAKGTSVQGDQPNAAALGRAIGAAVQAELVKQKRPGGLLA